eukprot:416932-Hanusia_phi.AAC.1
MRKISIGKKKGPQPYDPLLQAPTNFQLERLLAIFQSLVGEEQGRKRRRGTKGKGVGGGGRGLLICLKVLERVEPNVEILSQ